VSSQGSGEPARVAVVGISPSSPCGVRDHAGLLAQALGETASVTFHWLVRNERSLVGSRREIRAWAAQLTRELDELRPQAILFHYSVFAFSHKGVPIFVRPVLSALRRTGAPIVSVLHEFAYPWRAGGWRGFAWAATQRALLIEVMRSSAAAIVTVDSRASWLGSRPWLPSRQVLAAPVFSNLPAPAPGAGPAAGGVPVVGLFGYSYESAAVALTLDAFAELRARELDVELRLLGAPGGSSTAGEGWTAQARARGLEGSLSFTGALPAQALSDELASCVLLLSADTVGPTQRKGSLAGSLASGRPVIAIDGPNTWQELARDGAIRLVAQDPQALAAEIAALLADDDARESLGTRGREFAAEQMGVARTARAARTLLEEVLPRRP
jgi:glycosyltransferase involved in cell wall biosynthesis